MKKERLRQKLFDSAWQIVESDGIENLNARRLAKESSCALGSIYTIYSNFQELHLTLNAKILTMLYNTLAKTLEAGIEHGKVLKEVFRDLGLAYINFGQDNLMLWKALFEYLPNDQVPSWYTKHAGEGIYSLCEKLSMHYTLTLDQAKKIVGFFWASIHGICAIFLNQKLKMVSDLLSPADRDAYVEYSLIGLLKEVPDAQLASHK